MIYVMLCNFMVFFVKKKAEWGFSWQIRGELDPCG